MRRSFAGMVMLGISGLGYAFPVSTKESVLMMECFVFIA
jgi:hypothetical protein